MKFNRIITLALACVSLTAAAQTHHEGAEYFKADQLDNAKDLLLRSLNNPGTDQSVSDYYLGLIALNEKNASEAAKYFNAGVSANPENPYNYVGLGWLQLLNGDQKGAETLFKDGQKRAKKDAGVEVAIARAYTAVDPVKYEKQIAKCIDKARRQNMNHPDIYIFEGDQLRAVKDWGGAGSRYEMATTYNPEAAEAYVKYADLFTMVNPDYAIRMLKSLLEKNPQSALGQRELANAYYNKKDYANAVAEYAKYVNNPSHFKKDEDRYAFLLFYNGDYLKAYDYATRLLKENPKNFTAQRYQFMNAAQLPDLKDELLPMAEKLYANHKADPKNNTFAPIDYTLIAGELQTAKRPDEAVEVLNEAIKEMPENANFHKQLATLYVDENDLASAADAYQGYLAKTDDPGYNDFVQQAIYAYYGGAQNIQKDPKKSAHYFDMSAEYAGKAAEMAANQYKPVKILGDIAVAKSASDDLRATAENPLPLYLKAVELLESSADPSRYNSDAKAMYTWLGNYYVGNGDVPTAKMYYNKFLQIDPNNESVRNYVDSLK